jgi:hypothetical protein
VEFGDEWVILGLCGHTPMKGRNPFFLEDLGKFKAQGQVIVLTAGEDQNVTRGFFFLFG